MVKNTNKSLKLIKPIISKRIIAFLLNILVFGACSLALYFATLYGVFATGFNYIDNQNYINEVRKDNNLNLKEDLTYQEYEKVVTKLYYETYPDQIFNYYHEYDERISSLTHAYNVFVLNLPVEPTVEYYQTEYFKYQQLSDGSFDVNAKAIQISGSGKRYEANMQSLFYMSYSHLKDFVYKFDENFKKANDQNVLFERLSRTVAFIIPYIAFYIVIPLVSKNGSTLFEAKFNIGRVERKNGFRVKKFQTLIRYLVAFIIPFIGFYYFNLYSVILLTIAPLFLNILVMIINKNNYDLLDLICYTEGVDVSNSLIFKDPKEEYIYYKNNKNIYSDEEYVNALSNIDKIDLTISRDEKFKENDDKNISISILKDFKEYIKSFIS